ncbi:MAG: hypothetical protein U9P61_02105 [Patescibacteria group bacterium]|nr:hypothetical protein [Patescibacteria group bacterium]
MKITKEKIYLIYILLGSLYFISKVIFYACDFVYFQGVILGLTATVLTMWIGILSFKEFKKEKKNISHYLLIIFPLIILIYTPLHMTVHLGVPISQFPLEKFSIFLIFECLAIIQVILAFLMFKRK